MRIACLQWSLRIRRNPSDRVWSIYGSISKTAPKTRWRKRWENPFEASRDLGERRQPSAFLCLHRPSQAPAQHKVWSQTKYFELDEVLEEPRKTPHLCLQSVSHVGFREVKGNQNWNWKTHWLWGIVEIVQMSLFSWRPKTGVYHGLDWEKNWTIGQTCKNAREGMEKNVKSKNDIDVSQCNNNAMLQIREKKYSFFYRNHG